MSWRSKTFDELPALAVRKEELRRSLRLTTVSQMFNVAWMTCTGGSHVNVFARMLGFNNWQLGLMNAVPYVGNFGQILASVQIERSGLRKYQFLFFGVAYRALWIAVAAIPLLGIPSARAVWSLLAALLAISFFSSMATPAWMTWMGYVIPKRIRGRYFAIRSLYGRPVQMLSAILLGVILDHATRHDAPEALAASQPALLWVICGIFGVGGVLGVVEILLFWRIREVLPTGDGPPRPVYRLDHLGKAPDAILGRIGHAARTAASFLRQMLVAPLVEDRGFRHYVGYSFTIAFAGSIPGIFLWTNSMVTLGFNNVATNVLFWVIQPVLGLVGAKAWGRLIDRWGHRPALLLATSLMILSLLPWLLVTRQTAVPAWTIDAANWVFRHAGGVVGRPDWFLLTPEMPVGAYLAVAAGLLAAGIGWTGIGLAQMAVTLGFSEGQGRSKYVAASAVIISFGGALGGVVGGLVAGALEYYQKHPLHVGSFEWNNWHATFVLSILFRVVSLFWLVGMPATGSRPIRAMVRSAGESVSVTVMGWASLPLRLLGRWGRRDPRRKNGR
jgi:MFS family permease